MSHNLLPDNTKVNTWAMRNFREWRGEKGILKTFVDKISILLPAWNVHELDHWPARSTSIMQALTWLVLRISRSIVTLKDD